MRPTPLGGTESIVAVDKKAGEMGAAIVSQSFSIGSKAVWAEPGVGVVVAQGTVEPSYGSLGLALVRGGKTPAHALKSLLATDPRPDSRQVMIIDSRGRTAGHTGKNCLPEAGFLTGRGFCVQANFVNTKRAWRAMAARFRAERGDLATRMVAALEAGEQSAKGGRRGGPARSAALVVVRMVHQGVPWEGRVLDLRVESADSPLRQLKGLLKGSEAQERVSLAEELYARDELGRAEKEFAKASALAPESFEIRLRLALALFADGERKRGMSVLRGALGRGQDVQAIFREMRARKIIEEPSSDVE